jgi:hypothetical protein
MSRQTPALAAPPSDLTDFPTRPCTGTWFRAHSAGLGSWWYAHDGEGRFDLTAPNGTCYLGSHVEVAVRERLGETLVNAGSISAVEADRMVVARLGLDTTVADTTDQAATRYGITRELGTITPYTLPQQWAAALHAAGHAGLAYWPRFSVGGDRYAVGLFGPAGTDNQAADDPDPINGPDACHQTGIAVIGIPRTLPTTDPPGIC